MDIQKECLSREAFESLWIQSNGHFKYFTFSQEDGKYIPTGVRDNLTDRELMFASVTLNTAYLFFLGGLKSQPIPEGFVLDAPARVGGGTFQKGVKWSTVIKAAQRQFKFSQQRSDQEDVKDLKGILFDVPEGFTLINKECSDEMAEVIAATANVCGGIAGDIYDAVVKQAVAEAAEGE